jgi:hypothetical protein
MQRHESPWTTLLQGVMAPQQVIGMSDRTAGAGPDGPGARSLDAEVRRLAAAGNNTST